LHAKRSAFDLSAAATCFPADVLIKDAARAAVKRSPASRVEPVLAEFPGGGFGIVEALDLLSAALHEEVLEARHANPLTGLPGNRRIREFFENLPDAERDFVVVYADIDRFKSFNDRFGFAAGDLAISRLAELLQEASSACGPRAFVGHIGGDDFVVAVPEVEAERFRSRIMENCSLRWFDPEGLTDCETLSVTFAGVRLVELTGTFEEQAEALARLKTRLKQEGGNRFEVVAISEARKEDEPLWEQRLAS
jgi:diguanylate cyclase (GGDEF)-like protein